MGPGYKPNTTGLSMTYLTYDVASSSPPLHPHPSLSLGKARTRREDSTFLIVNLISDGCQAKHTPTFSTYERDKQYVIDYNDSFAPGNL